MDAAYRTSEPGVFAVGGLLHAAGTASASARQGRLAAVCVLDRLCRMDQLDHVDNLAAAGSLTAAPRCAACVS